VEKSRDGRLTLDDKKLFSLFVQLERAARESCFAAVQSAAFNIERYLSFIEKRQLMGFVYLYPEFSDYTPKGTLADESLEGGGVRKCKEYRRPVSDEEVLIGLWASLKYDQEGEKLLRVVYSGL
ncbi:MAG: hypothetical protein WBH04_16890, partial [Albidovulum sp.]